MLQIRMEAYGGPEVLRGVEVDRPAAGPGEVLVRVQAIGVNYADVLRRRNAYFMPTPTPFVLGTEAVGVIQDVGEGADATGLAVGTRVLAVLPQGGAYAEYVTAQPQYCIPLPPTLDSAAATAIFVQGSTAQLLTTTVVGESLAGKRVLITAAAGGVGSLLVQRCSSAGAVVTAATGSPAKAAFAKTSGARAVLSYAAPGWAAAVLAQPTHQGFDYVFDAVGGPVFAEAVSLLSDGGTVVVYGCASRETGAVDSERFVDRNLNLRSFNLAHYIQHRPDAWQQALGAVIGQVAGGELAVEVGCRYDLADAATAHHDLEARSTTGKVVLTTQFA